MIKWKKKSMRKIECFKNKHSDAARASAYLKQKRRWKERSKKNTVRKTGGGQDPGGVDAHRIHDMI